MLSHEALDRIQAASRGRELASAYAIGQALICVCRGLDQDGREQIGFALLRLGSLLTSRRQLH